MNVSVLREFLGHLKERDIAAEAVCPSDVASFIRTCLRKFRARLHRSPKNIASWQRQHTAPINRFLRLVQPRWPPPQPPSTGRERFHQETIDAYGCWLTEINGFSKGTLEKNCRIARLFLRWLGPRADRGSLSRLTVTEVDAFLEWRMPALRRASGYSESVSLRSFLRYLHLAKVLEKDLSTALRGPIIYKYDEIPRAFTEPQIKAMLSFTRRDHSPKGRRDYAVLLMLATYGLRAGEVVGLRLEDIDWRAELLHVLRSKTRTESTLPLVAPVAQALLEHLKRRPKTKFREVFLRSRAPIQPLSNVSSLNAIIEARMTDAKIQVDGRHGSHAFRFARALSLLRASVSMKAIGDLLGHRRVASTEVYLRLQTEDLRAISLDIPGTETDAEMAR
ncbi:MAG: tyrosine-type recombinase/integrase [Candidatus Acidiferrales bacterium]